MLPKTPDEAFNLAPSFWQQLTEGGPLYLLFHILFLLSVILALVMIFLRPSLPWMLLVSCAPFVWAAAAAHISFVSHLALLDSTAPPAALVAPFVYARRLFNWGCVVSAAFMVLAFICRSKNENSVNPGA
jgi:hypothetical protein